MRTKQSKKTKPGAMTKYMSDRAVSIATTLHRAFNYDRRYFLEAHVGSGIQGSVFRIKRVTPDGSPIERAVVKVLESIDRSSVFWDPVAEFNEKEALRVRSSGHESTHFCPRA